MLKDVVHGSGPWRIKVGEVYCSVGTPLLRVQGVRPGDRLKVTVGFQARTKKQGRGAGARFRIDPTGSLTPLAVAEGTFEGNMGWQSFGIVGFYQVRGRSSAVVDNIAFDLLFSDGAKDAKRVLDGRGRIREFLMWAELV